MSKRAPKAAISDADRQRLHRAVWAAWENNETAEFTDDANRRWFVGFEATDNHATILIQARRGQVIREQRLSTSSINPQTVAEAVSTIDGDFP